ncbi:hypothetical protein CRG98_023878 [Punica granatum]|uniref:Cathepsin propeptide inhibitor domain-containing protein n=1 Tax=Punica granatum TaxID=22663 RepID=A0A2I0JJK2_PUNGR|nr:hypothetical protein CRG98_023878 [Punica granatum]
MASQSINLPVANYFTITLFILFIHASSRVFSRPILTEDEHMLKKHEEWMGLHGRVYKDIAEKDIRFKIFRENVKLIDTFNNNNSKGSDIKLGVNKFADLTNEEFRATYTGYKRKATNMSNLEAKPFRYANFTAAPTSLDWRAKKAVTSVKDQGDCGS